MPIKKFETDHGENKDALVSSITQSYYKVSRQQYVTNKMIIIIRRNYSILLLPTMQAAEKTTTRTPQISHKEPQ